MSLEVCILVVTLFTLFLSLKWLLNTLGAGSTENLIKRQQKKLDELIERRKDKGAFVVAWVVALIISGTFITISTYVLTQIVKLG